MKYLTIENIKLAIEIYNEFKDLYQAEVDSVSIPITEDNFHVLYKTPDVVVAPKVAEYLVELGYDGRGSFPIGGLTMDALSAYGKLRIIHELGTGSAVASIFTSNELESVLIANLDAINTFHDYLVQEVPDEEFIKLTQHLYHEVQRAVEAIGIEKAEAIHHVVQSYLLSITDMVKHTKRETHTHAVEPEDEPEGSEEYFELSHGKDGEVVKKVVSKAVIDVALAQSRCSVLH